MKFSFRPGISYLAMAVAISVVFTLLIAAVAFITYEAGGVRLTSPNDMGRKGLTVGVGAFLISLVVIFVVSDYLMPHLCNWAGGSKKSSIADSAAAFMQQ